MGPFSLVQDASTAKVPGEHLQDAEAVPGIALGEAALRTVMTIMTLSLGCVPAEIARALALMLRPTAEKWAGRRNDPTQIATRQPISMRPKTLCGRALV